MSQQLAHRQVYELVRTLFDVSIAFNWLESFRKETVNAICRYKPIEGIFSHRFDPTNVVC